MILQRLYELAQREKLCTDPAFGRQAIACRVDIDSNGQLLGLHDLREQRELPARGKRDKPKVVLTSGKELSVPVRPVVWDVKRNAWKTTDPAASGKEKPAVFLADTIARVLPVERLIDESNRDKVRSQRSTFWRFLRCAVEQIGDDALRPLVHFADLLESSPDVQEDLARQVEFYGFKLADTCTLALQDDMGRIVLERPAIQEWWRKFFGRDFEAQEEGQYRGFCQVTGEVASIGSSVKSKISGLIPIGCRAEAFLVTGLSVAESYNLSGAQAAMVSAQGIDGVTRALNALIGNEFRGLTTHERVGGVMFLFWTRRPIDAGVENLFDPDPTQVAALLDCLAKGRESLAIDDTNAFYLLTLSGNSARVVVRDYLETPLPTLRDHLARWFRDLRIADLSKDGQGRPTSIFPLWQLALATAMDSDSVAPDTPSRLISAAIQGGAVSESLLVACLRRLRAEGAAGFRAARMALIKLTLLRKEIPVTETLNADERHPAYLYGRLLAVFEQIQYSALGDVNANVVDKFYGTFSAAPALIFSRLYANAQNHLRKLRRDGPGSFVVLDRLLTEVSTLLPASSPSRQLSFQDQGRFALGYYHQRAKHFEQIAERKATREAAAKSN